VGRAGALGVVRPVVEYSFRIDIGCQSGLIGAGGTVVVRYSSDVPSDYFLGYSCYPLVAGSRC
jgi:hypothetical protein